MVDNLNPGSGLNAPRSPSRISFVPDIEDAQYTNIPESKPAEAENPISIANQIIDELRKNVGNIIGEDLITKLEVTDYSQEPDLFSRLVSELAEIYGGNTTIAIVEYLQDLGRITLSPHQKENFRRVAVSNSPQKITPITKAGKAKVKKEEEQTRAKEWELLEKILQSFDNDEELNSALSDLFEKYKEYKALQAQNKDTEKLSLLREELLDTLQEYTDLSDENSFSSSVINKIQELESELSQRKENLQNAIEILQNEIDEIIQNIAKTETSIKSKEQEDSSEIEKKPSLLKSLTGKFKKKTPEQKLKELMGEATNPAEKAKQLIAKSEELKEHYKASKKELESKILKENQNLQRCIKKLASLEKTKEDIENGIQLIEKWQSELEQDKKTQEILDFIQAERILIQKLEEINDKRTENQKQKGLNFNVFLPILRGVHAPWEIKTSNIDDTQDPENPEFKILILQSQKGKKDRITIITFKQGEFGKYSKDLSTQDSRTDLFQEEQTQMSVKKIQNALNEELKAKSDDDIMVDMLQKAEEKDNIPYTQLLNLIRGRTGYTIEILEYTTEKIPCVNIKRNGEIVLQIGYNSSDKQFFAFSKIQRNETFEENADIETFDLDKVKAYLDAIEQKEGEGEGENDEIRIKDLFQGSDENHPFPTPDDTDIDDLPPF